jgi:hypothetical protein
MLQQELKHRYVTLGMSVVAVHGVANSAVEGSGAEVSVALDKIDKNFTNFKHIRPPLFPQTLKSTLNVQKGWRPTEKSLWQERGLDEAVVAEASESLCTKSTITSRISK